MKTQNNTSHVCCYFFEKLGCWIFFLKSWVTEYVFEKLSCCIKSSATFPFTLENRPLENCLVRPYHPATKMRQEHVDACWVHSSQDLLDEHVVLGGPSGAPLWLPGKIHREEYSPENERISPENEWLEDEISFWKGPFLGDMLIFWGYLILKWRFASGFYFTSEVFTLFKNNWRLDFDVQWYDVHSTRQDGPMHFSTSTCHLPPNKIQQLGPSTASAKFLVHLPMRLQ